MRRETYGLYLIFLWSLRANGALEIQQLIKEKMWFITNHTGLGYEWVRQKLIIIDQIYLRLLDVMDSKGFTCDQIGCKTYPTSLPDIDVYIYTRKQIGTWCPQKTNTFNLVRVITCMLNSQPQFRGRQIVHIYLCT